VSGSGMVATMPYAAEAGIDADVVLRADGTGGWPPIRWKPPRSAGGAHVVDIADDMDAEAGKAITSRLDSYQRMGWVIPGRSRDATHSCLLSSHAANVGTHRCT